MFFDRLRRDIATYEGDAPFYAQLGFWVTATYRVGQLGHDLKIKPLKYAALGAHKVLAAPWRLLRSVYIPAKAEIGAGLRMPHPQSVHIPPCAVIGEGCSIYHEVTLGTGPTPGVPTIGNNVMIFPGAKILGGVTVGDGSHIGANAVVTKDVPPGSMVASPPARAIPRETVEKMPHRQGRRGPNGEMLPED